MFPIRSYAKENRLQVRFGSTAIALLCGALVGASNSLTSAADANELFAKHCATCHGVDGKATSSISRKLGVKDLSQSKSSDTQIEQQIREGRPADQNSAKMPAFKDRLTAEEIKSLVQVVKKFRPQTKEDSNQTP